MGRKILVSIGSSLKSDDNVANLVLRALRTDLEKIEAGPNPENFIKALTGAERVFFLDAVDFGAEPGTVRLFSLNEVSSLAPSTHSFPVSLFSSMLPGTELFVVGIQPKSLELGEELTPELRARLPEIIKAVQELLDKE